MDELGKALEPFYGRDYCLRMTMDLEKLRDDQFQGNGFLFKKGWLQHTVDLLTRLQQRRFPIRTQDHVLIHLSPPVEKMALGELYFQVGRKVPGSLSLKFTRRQPDNKMVIQPTVLEVDEERRLAIDPCRYLEELRATARTLLSPGDAQHLLTTLIVVNSKCERQRVEVNSFFHRIYEQLIMPPRTRAKAVTPGKEAPAAAAVVEEKKEEKVEEPEVVEEPDTKDDEDMNEEEEEDKDEAEDAEDADDNAEDEKADEKKEDDADEKEGEDGSQDKTEGADEESKDGKTEDEKKPKIPIELDEKAKTWVAVVVGQVTYADFGLTELKLPLLKCNSFETRFFQEDDTKKGFVTMFFSKSWDAYVAVDKLRELEVPREGDKTANYSCWLLDKTQTHNLMRQETTTLKQLRSELNATSDQDPSLRSLFVANIPKSATKDLLTAIFAEAQDIVLPLAEPGKNKGYCYIEFSEGGEKLDEYLTKYQDIKIEDGEVSAKIIIRKIGNSITEKGKERASRMLKARSKQQIADLGEPRSDLGKKSSVDTRKPREGGKGNYRGSPYRGGSRFPRNERYDSRSRNYGYQNYGRGGPRDDRRDTGAAALAAIQQLLAKPMGMSRGRGRGGGGGSGGGGGGGGSSGSFSRRGTKRRFPGGFDDYGGDYGMAKVARRYDGPMGMEGPSSHFYEDQYDSGWGGSSFSQGYGGGGSGYMGGGGGGGGSGYGGSGMNDNRRRKNFRGGKFNKRN